MPSMPCVSLMAWHWWARGSRPAQRCGSLACSPHSCPAVGRLATPGRPCSIPKLMSKTRWWSVVECVIFYAAHLNGLLPFLDSLRLRGVSTKSVGLIKSLLTRPKMDAGELVAATARHDAAFGEVLALFSNEPTPDSRCPRNHPCHRLCIHRHRRKVSRRARYKDPRCHRGRSATLAPSHRP